MKLDLASHISLPITSLILGLILFSCAQPGTPDGGPPDKTPPQVVRTFPEVGSVNFREDKLVVTFDEFIKKPAYDKEILVSPLLKNRPKIKLNGKKLIIRFTEPLDLGVTYVVTLIDVQDFNAGNKMDQAFQLAFSTGATIDSMEVTGNVSNVYGEGAKEVTMLLFDADSVNADNLEGKRPAYITRTNASGNFTLGYLRPGPFRIFGVKDENGSRSYTAPNEAIALAEDPLIVFDTSGTEEVSLIISTPDQQAPIVNNVQWLTDSTLLLGFTEGIDAGILQVSLSDTNTNDRGDITDWVSLVNEIALPTFRPRDSISLLNLVALSDSLGNIGDTTLLLRPRRARLPENEFLVPPGLNPLDQTYSWVLPFIIPPGQDTAIALLDTGMRRVPRAIATTGLSSILTPDTALTPGIPYTITMPAQWWGYKDSTFSFGVKSFDPENYGTVQGRVHITDTSGYTGNYIIRLIGPETITLTDTLFDLKLLTAGNYKTQVILDQDSNGVWTPGSLVPYRLPERLMNGDALDVRANWIFEDYLINVGMPEVAETDSSIVESPEKE